ncbi:uncharacterized protein METZ01_LOCUS217656, partial [marine metagenome]
VNFYKKYLKLTPLLLIIGSIIFFTTNQTGFNLKQNEKSISVERGMDNTTNHTGNQNIKNHKNLETQKRMGIYHYNEGNKFLKQNKIEKSIENYKMALHHNKHFEEAYINLSTAYLRQKEFKLFLTTLNTLKSINSEHPLLHYNFSCYYSLLGDIPKGIESLKRAIKHGFK